MKELTIEQKAKAYDEALGKAKKLYEKGTITESIGYIFPELEKSEDERVRKALLNEFIHLQSKGYKFAGLEGEEIIAWLVKQGSVEEIVARCKKSWYNEGKIAGMAEGLTDDEKYQQGWHDAIEKQGEKADNANKVEPKFKVGDWITDGYLHCKISDVLDDRYIVDTKFTKRSAIPFKRENEYHLWTIADAKDGDVLYSLDSKQPFIFKHRKPNEQAEVYCGINIYGKFFVGNTKDCIITTDKYIPATKEQRDTLMKAMADAGYEWDADKKELKKIEQEPENYKRQVMSEMADLVIDYIKQKPTKWRPSNAQIDALEHFVRSIGESGFVSPYDANLKLVHSLLNDLKKLKEE